MPKKVLIALPPAMLEQVDFVAQCEHRTRSDLFREALRRYLDSFKRTQGVALAISTFDKPHTTLIEDAPSGNVREYALPG